MKKILLILSLFPILVFSQKSYKIPADSTILNNIGSGKNELVIRNATSNITGGVLTNLGNGVTAFVLGGGSGISQQTLNDSILAVRSIRKVDTLYKNFASDSIIFFINGIRYAVKDSFNLNTDSQTLSISNDTLTISGGNNVVLPFIPLSGTVSGSPVTGDIEVSPASIGNIYNNDGSQTTSISFEAGATTIRAKQNDNSLNGSFNVTTYSSTFSSDDVTSPGFQGAQDFSPNITDLDYTQKIYVDNAISSNRKVDTSYIFRNATLDSTCMITVINGITYRSCAKDSTGGGGASLSGLTAATASNTIDNASYPQTWQWSNLTSNAFGIKLETLNTSPMTTSGGALDIAVNATSQPSVRTVYGIRSIMTGGTSNTTFIAGYFESTSNFGAPWASWHKGSVRIEGTYSALKFDGTDNQIYSTGGSMNIRTSGGIYLKSGLNHGGTMFQDGSSNVFSSITPFNTSSCAFVMGGNAAWNPGAVYGSTGSSACVIQRSSDVLQLAANSGLPGGYFTPNFILNIKGSTSNVGIGNSTPSANAKLEITATTQAPIKLTPMTATQASALTAEDGQMVYVSTTDATFTAVGFWGRENGVWVKL